MLKEMYIWTRLKCMFFSKMVENIYNFTTFKGFFQNQPSLQLLKLLQLNGHFAVRPSDVCLSKPVRPNNVIPSKPVFQSNVFPIKHFCPNNICLS